MFWVARLTFVSPGWAKGSTRRISSAAFRPSPVILSPARFAAIKSVVHAHDADRSCCAFRKILTPADGHPKAPRETPTGSAGTCARQIDLGQLVRQLLFPISF